MTEGIIVIVDLGHENCQMIREDVESFGVKAVVCPNDAGREELEQFLTEAGFRDIVFTGDLTDRPPEPEEDRWIVRAVRPAEEPCI